MVHTNKDVDNISKLYFESAQKEELIRKELGDGTIVFYNKAGQLHNPYGPAVITKSDKSWYINGARHREDGPAIEYANGDYVWFKHGKKHRLDGPTSIYNGTGYNGRPEWWEEWWVDGQLHKEDGPAVTSSLCNTYYIRGKQLTKHEFDEFLKKKEFRKEIQARADNVFDDNFLKELD